MANRDLEERGGSLFEASQLIFLPFGLQLCCVTSWRGAFETLTFAVLGNCCRERNYIAALLRKLHNSEDVISELTS